VFEEYRSGTFTPIACTADDLPPRYKRATTWAKHQLNVLRGSARFEEIWKRFLDAFTQPVAVINMDVDRLDYSEVFSISDEDSDCAG
jgi:hypothetical protein